MVMILIRILVLKSNKIKRINTVSRLTRKLGLYALPSILLSLTTSPAFAEDLQQRVDELQQKIEALAEALDNQQSGATGDNRLSIGGYGELHYNNLSATDPSRDVDKIDFHRFVLFFGYEFSDDIRFVSEFELEHSLAGEGKPGEIELEQAYIEFGHGGGNATQAGIFLIPIGIINETHEPPSFYGVERNDVENIIIPATWWEAGVQHIQRFGDSWQLNIAAHSGLSMPTTGGSAFRIRSGRRKVAEAQASDFAITSRLKYTGIQGLELAVSAQVQADPTQQSTDGLDDGTLIEAHAIYNTGPFSIRALYASWDFSGSAVEATGNNEADSQNGWYVEPSYKITNQFGIYARASEVEAARDQDNFEQTEVGFNWWPQEQVVVKFTYRDREHALISAAGRDFDGFDLGLGYQF